MSVLDWLKRPFERRAMTLRDPDGWRVLFGTQTAAGTIVTPETALGHPAILGAVRLLAELTASLPLVVYERTDAGRRRATEHPVYRLLHEAPNDAMTPFTFKETLVLHLLLFGNAYALVVRSGGRPVALWPLHPTRVYLDDTDGVFTYKVTGPGGTEQHPPENIVHIPILAPDGVRGQAPVTLAREAIGAALAAEEHAALYFANGAQPSGVLVHPGQLSETAVQRLRDSWRAAHGGRNRQGIAVLEGGMEYKPIANTAKDAQLIEARQFAMRLLAAAMRIPPHLLDPSVRGAYANVETQSLEFLTFSLQPLLTRFEEAFTRRLFTAQERRRYYAEFLVDGLLRADIRTRYEAYKTAIQAGFMDADEARERENMPVRPSPIREPADDGATRRAPNPERRALPEEELHVQLVRSLEAALREVLVREGDEVLSLVEAHVDKRADLEHLEVALRDYYAAAASWIGSLLRNPFGAGVQAALGLGIKRVEEAIAQGVLPKTTVTAETAGRIRERVAERVLRDYVAQHAAVSQAEILAAARLAASDSHLLEAVERVVTDWVDGRAAKAAQLQAAIVRNETARAVYREAGATKLRWVANEGACDFCRGLHGKVVGFDQPFVAAGETLAGPDGQAARPLVARTPRLQPPIHVGCACVIVPGG